MADQIARDRGRPHPRARQPRGADAARRALRSACSRCRRGATDDRGACGARRLE
ncbi:MAG: hypothetical protein MZW92_13855 [Comamonadaceae bacterium]|nr:hypothetical protein [Comamonadaceae bacterium]